MTDKPLIPGYFEQEIIKQARQDLEDCLARVISIGGFPTDGDRLDARRRASHWDENLIREFLQWPLND